MLLEDLEKVAISGLYRSYHVHEELGIYGTKMVKKNQFGDFAVIADIMAEEAVIDKLRIAQVPIQIISEEHGVVELGEHPQFLGVLDGIDGTSVYTSQRGKGKYGTMLVFSQAFNTCSRDFLFPRVTLIHLSRSFSLLVRMAEVLQSQTENAELLVF